MALFCSFLCFKRHTGSFIIANIQMTELALNMTDLNFFTNQMVCLVSWRFLLKLDVTVNRLFTKGASLDLTLKDCWLGEKERFVLNIYFCSLEKRIRYQFLHTLDNISWRHQYQCHSDVCSCVGCDIRCLANLDPTSTAFGDVNVVPTGRHSRHYFQLWSWKAIQTCVT